MKQRIHLGLQLRIFPAKTGNLFVLLLGRPIANGEENLLNALILFRCHASL
jgi:hypothetical protein